MLRWGWLLRIIVLVIWVSYGHSMCPGGKWHSQKVVFEKVTE